MTQPVKQEEVRKPYHVTICEAVQATVQAMSTSGAGEIKAGMQALEFGLDLIDVSKAPPEALGGMTKCLYALRVNHGHLAKVGKRLDETVALLVAYQLELVQANKLDSVKAWSPPQGAANLCG